jgi:hypothetical protein
MTYAQQKEINGDYLIHLMCDKGILQEVNRTFFHPLGLALSVDMVNKHLILYETTDEAGFWFDHLDKMQRFSFNGLANERFEKRSEKLGFIIQTADIISSTAEDIASALVSPASLRMAIILKSLDLFAYFMKKKLMEKNKKYDNQNGFMLKEELISRLKQNIEDEDWVDVGNFAALLNNYEELETRLSNLDKLTESKDNLI